MKKIMFNDRYGLTTAVLEGRKTQTRRIIKLSHVRVPDWFKKPTEKDLNFIIKNLQEGPSWGIELCAPYAIGEEVAVAQAYKSIEFDLPVPVSSNAFEQKQAYHIYGDTPGWHNKMFVCAYLMPHRIKITNVRVERLQDISDEDCRREGIHVDDNAPEGVPLYKYIAYSPDADPDRKKKRWWYDTPRKAFAALIDLTCGRGTWDSNPYVFVFDFELVK